MADGRTTWVPIEFTGSQRVLPIVICGTDDNLDIYADFTGVEIIYQREQQQSISVCWEGKDRRVEEPARASVATEMMMWIYSDRR
jgi:hypothetical protein